MNRKLIAVTGATGLQGGAIARKLLAQGWQVRALTREPGKPAAQELAALGAQVVPGDLEKRADLDAAFKDAFGVFSVQNYWLPGVGFEGEIRQGKSVADAALASGVGHLVFSSVGAANRGMGQKHFESKWLIEQHIQSLGISYTILRPAAFMENNNWRRAFILAGTYEGMGLQPSKTVQTIAVEDIAVFAALAFADPTAYRGKTLELAGDELTESQTAEVFTRVIGRPVIVAVPSGNPRGPSQEEMMAMFKFFNGEGYGANIPALRKLHPGLLTLEQFLRKNGWENQQPIPLPGASAWGG